MHWLGLDIGGANIKLADGRGTTQSRAFALWQRPHELANELRTMIAAAPACDQVAVTMTGELADCFPSKAAGVRQILDAVEQAIDHRTAHVYLTTGELENIAAARHRADEVAAANWHALASFAGRFAPAGWALLADVGSTTCDLIPLRDGVPIMIGRQDTARLQSGELIYSGVARTPLCGLVNHLPWQGAACPVAREWFATTRDVYLLTGDVPEDAANCDTADGQPATRDGARIRLARMICEDPNRVTQAEAVAMAESVARQQTNQIAEGMQQIMARLPTPPDVVIVSGEGEFLARRAVRIAAGQANVISLRERLGEGVSRCAPAHAVAVLALEASQR